MLAQQPCFKQAVPSAHIRTPEEANSSELVARKEQYSLGILVPLLHNLAIDPCRTLQGHHASISLQAVQYVDEERSRPIRTRHY